MTKQQKAERDEAIATLKKQYRMRKGDTVYTILKHVSRSGMRRVLDLYIIRKGEPLRITWSAALALRQPYDRKHEGLVTDACGMDAGFHEVYNLGCVLFGIDGNKPLNQRWL